MDHGRKVDILSGSILLVLAIFLFISTLSFQQMTVAKIGSAFFPQVASIGIGALSIIMILMAILKNPTKEDQQEGDIAEDSKAMAEERHIESGTEKQEEKKYFGLVAITLVLLVTYIALMQPLGFIISTSLYLFAQMFIISTKENRKYLVFAVLSVGSSLLIYWAFKGFFNLMLPAGLLG